MERPRLGGRRNLNGFAKGSERCDSVDLGFQTLRQRYSHYLHMIRLVGDKRDSRRPYQTGQTVLLRYDLSSTPLNLVRDCRDDRFSVSLGAIEIAQGML